MSELTEITETDAKTKKAVVIVTEGGHVFAPCEWVTDENLAGEDGPFWLWWKPAFSASEVTKPVKFYAVEDGQ